MHAFHIRFSLALCYAILTALTLLSSSPALPKLPPRSLPLRLQVPVHTRPGAVRSCICASAANHATTRISILSPTPCSSSCHIRRPSFLAHPRLLAPCFSMGRTPRRRGGAGRGRRDEAGANESLLPECVPSPRLRSRTNAFPAKLCKYFSIDGTCPHGSECKL